ncbi:synaptonemal complex central element protein 2 [Gopherus evgoodei]|uniref:synaptonemal complex central element protein 2 n=1 Tax=Gopherus evgoodei TaxID=1825980 RepID=UPI0011CF05D2|nr:synaptonemal complex central element protein 2 [Gopherus evgoodei]
MSTQECESPELEEEQAKPDSPFFDDIERRELHILAFERKWGTEEHNTCSLFQFKCRKESPSTSLLCPTADASVAALDGKSSNYFAALDSNIENLQRRTQQLIEKINENRKKDHTVMSNFRESLMLKVSSLAEKLEESMFLIYDRHNKQMQDKLQELSEIMERISQIQTELRQVCHTVEAAYKDLCVQSEV